MSRFAIPSACLSILLSLAGTAAAVDPPALRVALYDDAGAGDSLTDVARVLSGRPDVHLERIAADEIRTGRLDRFDVLIQPGGSGGTQGRTLGKDGRRCVRSFVDEGGGFVGICAGAYLASCEYDWSIGLLDAKVLDREHWARGYGPVELAVSSEGRQVLAIDSERQSIYYHQGPLLAPAGDPDVPDYTTWATYAGEIAKNGAPQGVMPGTTAVAAGQFGKGRVLCFSPHPEKTAGLGDVLYRGVLWSASRSLEGAPVEAEQPDAAAE